MTLTVSVTTDNIEQGVPFNPCACALALAVKDALPVSLRRCNVLVGTTDVSVSFGPAADVFPLPLKAVEFRRDFDLGNKVSPFSFKLSNNYL